MFLKQLDNGGIGENLGLSIAISDELLVVFMEMWNADGKADALMILSDQFLKINSYSFCAFPYRLS